MESKNEDCFCLRMVVNEKRPAVKGKHFLLAWIFL